MRIYINSEYVIEWSGDEGERRRREVERIDKRIGGMECGGGGCREWRTSSEYSGIP